METPFPASRFRTTRHLPVGAEPTVDAVDFRVWAPKRQLVEVQLANGCFPLTPEGNGYHSGVVAAARTGDRYRLRLDGGEAFPDPASRFQPDGPHGPSLVVDHRQFAWTDDAWTGVPDDRCVIYETHIGTFTQAGTWRAALGELQYLAGLGVDVLEVMPLAEFSGRFGWGYDGVNLFAPFHHYGAPDDFRAFVDRAHAEGLGVILDVVYNHLGPDGNFLPQFSDRYFSATHKTDWGDGINFDGEDSGPVREFMISNARYWIEEFHLDGLRLDATHSIHDHSPTHIMAEVGQAARAAAPTRSILVVAESEPQDTRLVGAPLNGGYGLQKIWCDDFHHSAIVAATGRREAYFTDYRGSAQEFVSAIKHSVLYQGQHYAWQKQRRGSDARGVPRHRCVFYLENHDQVANSLDGRRLHQITSPGRYRALTALLLLAPQSPMLFQGQEFGSSAPFLYFADHKAELARLVRAGRIEFLQQFVSIASIDTSHVLDDPADEQTFARSKLNGAERTDSRHESYVALHRDLMRLRRRDPVLASAETLDGAVLGMGAHAFVLRFFGDTADRLLVVNLAADLDLDIAPEPLLAPPRPERGWRTVWQSEHPRYGGRGAPRLESEDGAWRIPAESATLLAPAD